MKRYLLLLILLAPTLAAAYSCPAGYNPIPGWNNSNGVGSNKPQNGCYQTAPSGAYDRISFDWTVSGSPTLCLVQQYATGTNDQGYNSGLMAYGTVTGGHCQVTATKQVAGTVSGYSFSNCDGGSCSRTNTNSGSGGWSSNPLGAQTSTYNITAPQPTSGTFSGSILIEGDPTPPANFQSRADISTYWAGGTEPGAMLMNVTVDSLPCVPQPSDHNRCTVGTVKLAIACSNYLSPNSSLDWDVTVSGGGYLCQFPSSLGYNRMPIPMWLGGTGAHTVVVTVPALSLTASYSFTVTTPSPISYTAPVSYPSLPAGALATWLYNIAGTGVLSSDNCGYVCFANAFLSAETTTPGIFNNDSSSAGTWDGTFALPFYDVGEFALQMGDQLGICHTGSAMFACPNWSHTAVTQGQILDNGSCFLDVQTGGTTASSAPTCPAVGSNVTDGGAVEQNIGTQTWWYDLAQNIGDQFRNNKDIQVLNFNSNEWDLFSISMDEMYFRTSNNLYQWAIAYQAKPFVSTNSPVGLQKLAYDGWQTTDTERSAPLDLLVFDMQWRTSNVRPVDSAGVDMIDQWTSFVIGYVNRLTSCTVTGNITAGWPNCANNVNLGSQCFDAGLIVRAFQETCMVEQEKAGACNPLIPPTELKLLDWMYSNQYAPDVALGYHSQPYAMFSVPVGPSNDDFAQPQLNMMLGDGLSWMGGWCGNCNLPTSGTPVWTVGDDYMANSFQGLPSNIYVGAKQLGQMYYGLLDYLHHRTNPSSGGWTAQQSETSAARNPSQTWPNLLGPYPQATEPTPPAFVSTGAGAGTWTWYSAPNASTFICYALVGTDPFPCTGGGITKVTGSAGATFNTEANLVVNTLSVSGLAAGTYNVAFGAVDSASNSAVSDNNYSGGYFTMTISTSPGGISWVTSSPLPQGTVGVAYSAPLQCTGGTGPYTYSQTFGSIPGLGVSGATLGGTPTTPGVYAISLRCTDSLSAVANKAFNGTIIQGSINTYRTQIGGSSVVGGGVVIH